MICFRCGNKFDLKSRICVTDSDIENLCEQCNNLVTGVYKTSCKTGEGVEDMFVDIARHLSRGSNRYYTGDCRPSEPLVFPQNAL